MPQLQPFRTDLVRVLFFVVGFVTTQMAQSADCPRLCECKWKSGKESVICLNANLSSVPVHLEASTQVLDLTGNNLAAVHHDEFSKAGLLNLQKVYVAKCRLKNLERYAFRHLINLVELDLSYNVLGSVPSHTFDSVPELRELKLNGNPIARIANDAFVNVPQLVRLELSDCRLVHIELRAFRGLERTLEWLKLDKNRLAEVRSSSFTVLHSLHGLELAANPWNCSCALRPLREWMLRQNVPFGVPPVCHTPKRLGAKPWDKLDLDEFACIPEIIAYESKTHGVEGRNITMTCRIAGIPEPSVRWLLKNKVIANLSGSGYANGKKLYMVHLQNNSSDLTIFSADLQDAGVYVCAAENKAGKAEASVTLAVIKKPPAGNFSSKILVASIVTGIVLVLASCLISLCVYSVRKKQLLRWQNRECRREDNYEKIEMNHKVTGNNSNGGAVQAGNGNGGGGGNGNGGNGVGIGGVSEIALVSSRKNGDYRVVPAADTDQEHEDDEDETVSEAAVSASNKNPNKHQVWTGNENISVEKRWNSPEHLLDPEDLHIPRRTLQEARDDIRRAFSSTSGTYNYFEQPPATTSATPHVRKQLPQLPPHAYVAANAMPTTPATKTTTMTTHHSEQLIEDDAKKFPDLIENSSSYSTFNNCCPTTKANSEGGSITDITELFCTLPRKRGPVQSSRYKSTDSQAPLLADSRYGSSGGESNASTSLNNPEFRRLSDCQQKYLPVMTHGNLNRNRINKTSNSYMNLTRDAAEPSSTPLLDVTGLENHVYATSNNGKRQEISPTTGTPNANSYDYHAAQLERFLEEYRSLQKQLTKMKETCDNLRQGDNKQYVLSPPGGVTPSPSQPLLMSSSSVTSPNSNNFRSGGGDETSDFRSFESELTKYLLAKSTSSSPKPFGNNASSGVFNN